MTAEERQQLAATRRKKAEQSYAVAEEILKDYPLFAVNRYYYALFYAVGAVLILLDVSVKTHKGTINAFNRELVSTGKLGREEGRLLAKVFLWRTQGDYDDDRAFTVEEVREISQPVRKLMDRLNQLA